MSLSDPNPLLRLLPPLLVMAAIFYLSAQPFEGPDLAWYEVVARKLGHVGGYALLTTAWGWALRGLVARPIAWAAAISFLYACSDEYHQTFVDGRAGTVTDVLIDSAGIALASVAIGRRGRRTEATA
ncbi:MAG TPA: VanZ family protein [Solirubrobacterales bacterium]|nr:VanZ family protein [Solirubrobacterales bacterium]